MHNYGSDGTRQHHWALKSEDKIPERKNIILDLRGSPLRSAKSVLQRVHVGCHVTCMLLTVQLSYLCSAGRKPAYLCSADRGSAYLCSAGTEPAYLCTANRWSPLSWLKMHKSSGPKVFGSWGWGLEASEGCTGQYSLSAFVKLWPGFETRLCWNPLGWTLISVQVYGLVILP